MTTRDRPHVLLRGTGALLVAVIAMSVHAGTASAQPIPQVERVSVSNAGVQAFDNSFDCAVSGDGGVVAFSSVAANLIAGDTNGVEDVFVRLRTTVQTRLVSHAPDGTVGNGRSGIQSTGGIELPLSGDGRWLVYVSSASNLVAGGTGGGDHVFLYDRDTDSNELMSRNAQGQPANNSCRDPAISSDGRWIGFVSFADNLVAGDTNGRDDVFVRDRLGGALTRVSLADDDTEANNYSLNPVLSADGRYVAFASVATNLIAGDSNSRADVFVRDRDSDSDGIYDEPGAAHTIRVSIADNGSQVNAEVIDPSISGDGRYVAFPTRASTLVPGDTQLCASGFFNCEDLFVYDRDRDADGIYDEPGQTGIERAVLAFNGTQAAGDTFGKLALDGRHLGFLSSAQNILPDNVGAQVYQRDLLSGQTRRLSLSPTGAAGNNGSQFYDLSASGAVTCFISVASNLVSGDTNNRADAFVAVLAPPDRVFTDGFEVPTS